MSSDFNVVLDALEKRRDDLWKMTQRNMASEYVGLNIMDDIRLRQIDELDDAIKSISANNDFKERLAQAIEQMPFGDTAASFAQFVRNFK